jgi:hypothetical protein
MAGTVTARLWDIYKEIYRDMVAERSSGAVCCARGRWSRSSRGVAISVVATAIRTMIVNKVGVMIPRSRPMLSRISPGPNFQ